MHGNIQYCTSSRLEVDRGLRYSVPDKLFLKLVYEPKSSVCHRYAAILIVNSIIFGTWHFDEM